MKDLNFIAIDFETATATRASVCEAGICVVRDGKVVETDSWLVRPQHNQYSHWNIAVHGILPEQTAEAPDFPAVWRKIEPFLAEIPVLVAHNAAFDMSCIRQSMQLYGMEKPEITYYCTLRAASRLYDFDRHSLGYLCDQFGIDYGTHHRAGADAEMCARLFLREIRDAGEHTLAQMRFCGGIL